MSDLNKLKELRNALACWQEDYDPTEDKEQFDMFGDAVDAVARLASAERRMAEQDAVIAQRNAECDRLIIEKGLLRIKSAPGKPDYFIHRVEVCDSYGPEVLLRAFNNALDASKCKDDHGGEVVELFATPPAPNAPDGWAMLPAKLSAENGAKAALSGEFLEVKFISCSKCFGDDDSDSCDGSGRVKVGIPVSWTTIKAIWEKGVQHFSAAPAPGDS